MSRPATITELSLARQLCPDLVWDDAVVNEDGQFHSVLIANKHAVIRTARTADATADMPRSVRLHELVSQQLNYAIPTPCSQILTVDSRSSVAMSFIPGAAHKPFSGDPQILRQLVADLASVSLEPIDEYLAPPFAYAGPWTAERQRLSYDALPLEFQNDATTLWAQLEFLAQAPSGLVHGDLLGHNMHWQGSQLTGILDWDLASCWDPALNSAYLCFWHGYDLMDQLAGDAEEAHRAKIWTGLMYLERLSASVDSMVPVELEALIEKIGPRIKRAAALAI